MLRALAPAIQATVLFLVAYNLITSLWGWRNQRRAPVGKRSRRFRVVVPAHNEQAVIGRLLNDLSAQEYEDDLVSVWVLADRCTDNTAGIGRASAAVAERSGGPDGKGAALTWYLDHHPMEEDETLLVLDADNRIPGDFLARLADEMDEGAQAVQAYLDVSNPDDSMMATASAISYWASNRMVQLARRNLGWAADLGGTGMAITAPALNAAGGFSTSVTEDQDLGARLLLAGHATRWIHDLHVADEKPTGLAVAIRQRARWTAGKTSVRRDVVPRLVRQPRPVTWDLALRIMQPSRTFVALVSGVLALISWLWPNLYLMPWPFWAIVTAVQFLVPIPFLIRDRVPARYLWRYPLVTIFGIIYMPVRLLGRLRSGWYHTPHGGD